MDWNGFFAIVESVNGAVNSFIWGVPAMICIVGVGGYLTLRTRFLQLRKFPYALKIALGRIFRRGEAADGAMTPFQAVCTALAATVGTGNIAGVAGATVDLGLLWSVAETFNGLTFIPNQIAVFLLSGVVVRLLKEYFQK